MGNRFHCKTSKADKIEMKMLYESGKMTKDIALLFNVSDRWVRLVLAAQGVKVCQHKGIKLPERILEPVYETIDFSVFPDTVLFSYKNCQAF